MDMKLDAKYIGGGLAAIGMLAAASAGYLTITTPEAQECAIELADAKARLELGNEIKAACKTALESCIGDTP